MSKRKLNLISKYGITKSVEIPVKKILFPEVSLTGRTGRSTFPDLVYRHKVHHMEITRDIQRHCYTLLMNCTDTSECRKFVCNVFAFDDTIFTYENIDWSIQEISYVYSPSCKLIRVIAYSLHEYE